MSNVCKRCGDVGHYVATCPNPSTEPKRPDLERIYGRLERGEQKTVGADVVMGIIDYCREMERHRRVLLSTFRLKSELTPASLYPGVGGGL